MMVTAITVTYNSADVIETVLHCVYGHPKVAECIVVDNASRDETLSIVQAKFPKVRILRNVANEGFGVACNQALETVATELALLLNPDAFIAAEGIDVLVRSMTLYPDAAIIAPVIAEHETAPVASQEAIPVTFVSGAVAMWRMQQMRNVGFFDPAFFMFYEDNDISRRVLRASYSLLLQPGIEVSHIPGNSCVLTGEVESLKLRSSTWSFLYITGKYHGRLWAKLKTLPIIVRASFAYVYYDLKRADKPSAQLSADLAALERDWHTEECKLRQQAQMMEAMNNERLAAIIRERDECAVAAEVALSEEWERFTRDHNEKFENAQTDFEERWKAIMARNENLQAAKTEHEKQWAHVAQVLDEEWAGKVKQHEQNRAERVAQYEKVWFAEEAKIREAWQERTSRQQEQFSRLVRQYEMQRATLLKSLEASYPAMQKKKESRDILQAALYYLRNPERFRLHDW